MNGGTEAGEGRRPVAPIGPEDAADGWEIAGSPESPCLAKDYGEHLARVTATAGTTCAWRVARPDGTMLRESSARDVGEAKALADAWVEKHRAAD
ncbi:hypothetical protein [Nocardia sp. alder85J]|uniref:hypothetical protein n=1 Tax=Nocardia sp. alder85J TaxID=2862949 RepID=UPI001CD7CCF6|nr:hypothetical protein [Nocardia sp. alder85J]MCX4093247.1 hypothetical protein [Nocardia sp. alder85J]